MKRLNNVHARYHVDRMELHKKKDIKDKIRNMLIRRISDLIIDDFDNMPIVMTEEGPDDWTPDHKFQVDMYLVDEKTYRLLESRFSKDLLERLNNIPIEDLYKFVAKYNRGDK